MSRGRGSTCSSIQTAFRSSAPAHDRRATWCWSGQIDGRPPKARNRAAARSLRHWPGGIPRRSADRHAAREERRHGRRRRSRQLPCPTPPRRDNPRRWRPAAPAARSSPMTSWSAASRAATPLPISPAAPVTNIRIAAPRQFRCSTYSKTAARIGTPLSACLHRTQVRRRSDIDVWISLVRGSTW